jgi:hypothetical protein
MLGFTCVTPIKTIHVLLEAHGAFDLLRDPLITTATPEISAEKRTRREIQARHQGKRTCDRDALRQVQLRTSTPAGDSSASIVQYRGQPCVPANES